MQFLQFHALQDQKKKEQQVKFSFANFHKNKWDVEHISPQNPKDIEQITKELEAGNVNDIFTDLLKKINNGENYDKEFKNFFAVDEESMEIGNLTLLIVHDNRGIGNKFFYQKRQRLQEYYQKGSFIPACSMNVFMKFYSDNPIQMAFWDETDRDAYKNQIEITIREFFKNGQ